MKKLFVVLEQGNIPNRPLTKIHKDQFTTPYCDFFRLNWQGRKDDKYADFYAKDIVWSEGRSILYDKVKGMYKYYIFIDDDILFKSITEKKVAEEIKNFLEIYNPLSGTFYGNIWSYSGYRKKIYRQKREAFCIMGHDLCCHIFHESLASLMFPVIYHGSGGSMWYAQFLAHRIYPRKCLVSTKVHIVNSEHIKHNDETKKHYKNGKILSRQFCKLLKNPEDQKQFMMWSIGYIKRKNKNIYNLELRKDKVEINLNILKKILNLDSDYKNRTVTV